MFVGIKIKKSAEALFSFHYHTLRYNTSSGNDLYRIKPWRIVPDLQHKLVAIRSLRRKELSHCIVNGDSLQTVRHNIELALNRIRID